MRRQATLKPLFDSALTVPIQADILPCLQVDKADKRFVGVHGFGQHTVYYGNMRISVKVLPAQWSEAYGKLLVTFQVETQVAFPSRIIDFEHLPCGKHHPSPRSG